MALVRTIAIVMSAACLFAGMGGCATTASKTAWLPRTDADLTADTAACEKDAQAVDMQSASAYSDGRYGVAAAMAGRMDRSSMRSGGADRMYNAIVYSCMTRKGWKPAG